jgi:hypothetical protein
MQTAMQELIEWLDIAIEELKGNDSTDFAEGLVAARVKANKALEKEKEQIADAFRNGSTSSMLGGGHWTQYYNQTYNQNK